MPHLSRLTLYFFWMLLIVAGVRSFPEDEDKQFWYEDGEHQLRDVLARRPVERVAKNVVLIIGDGMGMSTVTAGRIYRGQQQGLGGEEYQLAFEKFSHVGLAKTYNVNAQVGESAACATALFCGVKTKYHRVGVDSSSSGDHCSRGKKLTSLMDWAQADGKATGLVTNTRLTHSTPSATYARTKVRHWESDAETPAGCQDIAAQLVDNSPGRNIDVLFGGGRQNFLPNTTRDPEGRTSRARSDHSASIGWGARTDSRDLIREWGAMKRRAGQRAFYVWNKADFDRLDPSNTDSVLGLFEPGHMEFEMDRDKTPTGDPSLAEMTVKAIRILSHKGHKNGFLLVVEAGLIDISHHAGAAQYALSELVALDEAVRGAVSSVDGDETLLVVTGDHSHVFTFGGKEAWRNNSILGIDLQKDKNGIPYTTLLYGNGPGHVKQRNSSRLKKSRSPDYRQEAAVPLSYETHGGEDVPVYANGPWSHLFTGTFQQSYVAHAISFAACIGPRKALCKGYRRPELTDGADTYRPTAVMTTLCTALVLLWARWLSG